MKCLTLIFLSSEFACFVIGEIIQVIEAMPGSVVPLACFWWKPVYGVGHVEEAGLSKEKAKHHEQVRRKHWKHRKHWKYWKHRKHYLKNKITWMWVSSPAWAYSLLFSHHTGAEAILLSTVTLQLFWRGEAWQVLIRTFQEPNKSWKSETVGSKLFLVASKPMHCGEYIYYLSQFPF